MKLAFTLSFTLATFTLIASGSRPAGLSAAEKKAAKAIITSFFATTDVAARQKLLTKLARIDHPSATDLKAFQRLAFKLLHKGPKHDGRNKSTCQNPKYPGQFYIHVPSSAKTRKTGVFFGLHGGGPGVGDGAQIQRIFGRPSSKLICVYPTVIKKVAGAWNKELQEGYVLAILSELKRTYKIDTNRVYVAGHSMGGFGTWSIGGRHADRFAAAASMAGGTWGHGIIPNFHNLPFWCYHSKDDAKVPPKSDIRAIDAIRTLQKKHGGYPHVWKLLDGIGHGFPKKGVRPIFKWMLKHQREPQPDSIVWEPSRSSKRHFYWLAADSLPRETVVATRSENTFTISRHIPGLWIGLNKKNCNLKAPIVIKVGNEIVNSGTVAPSLVALIDSIAAHDDPELVFTARIRATTRNLP